MAKLAKDRYESGKKLIFLDFDGTYADDGVVPPGHVRAVRAAQLNGHQVFLCTGRPLSGLSDEALAVGFDGLVCAAGGYVLIDGQVLLDRRFPHDLAERALAVLDSHGGSYILETPEFVYVTKTGEERLRKLFRTHTDMLDRLRVLDSLAGIDFSKITVLTSHKPIRQIAADIGEGVQVLPGSVEDWGALSGELQLADVNKSIGIDVVANYLGTTAVDAVACGDGLNDLEMIAHAGIGVGIEGGNKRIVEIADIVVPGPRKEGLATAFAELGLT